MNTRQEQSSQEHKQSSKDQTFQKQRKHGTFQFVDKRPEATEQQRLINMMNNSPQVKQLKQFQEMADNYSASQKHPIQKKENNTGLPDNLKAGIENLSGHSMDDVKVHYNSDKPAQLNAHAYAQGTDIHIASGQEKHLPHEAWHVVQQKQGRVKPTLQLYEKVDINNDERLEKEADSMGEKAHRANINQKITEENPNNSLSLAQSNPIQLNERKYDETMAPHKTRLMEWLIDVNNTLGISQKGESSGSGEQKIKSDKKSNFGWHHILAFADLKGHGTGKTAPANHGLNLRLGPMKNRFEGHDISGGTAIDYGYLPLDSNDDIVLDEYSKSIFKGEVSATKGIKSKLDAGSYTETPQAKKPKGQEKYAFSEWFLSTEKRKKILSNEAISSKLNGVSQPAKEEFIKQINTKLNSFIRTYKYYNQKKEVQKSSGVAMTDLSGRNFASITAVKEKGGGIINAGTVIDELLRDEKWVSRGSQGAIQDVKTTYQFGLFGYEPFTNLMKESVKNVDLSDYKKEKLKEFRVNLNDAFEELEDYQSDDFQEFKENSLIEALHKKLKDGANNYESLWEGIQEADIENLYTTTEFGDEEAWDFPVPDSDDRLEAVTKTKITNSEGRAGIKQAWANVFVKMLNKWEGTPPLLIEDNSNPYEETDTNIDFEKLKKSLKKNEQQWQLKKIDRERFNNSVAKIGQSNFLSENLTFTTIMNAIFHAMSEDIEKYWPQQKVAMELEELKNLLEEDLLAQVSIISKQLKGVGENGIVEEYETRHTVFGPELEGYIVSMKWKLINDSGLPKKVKGLNNKKWAELGTMQDTLYKAWLDQKDIKAMLNKVITSESLSEALLQ